MAGREQDPEDWRDGADEWRQALLNDPGNWDHTLEQPAVNTIVVVSLLYRV